MSKKMTRWNIVVTRKLDRALEQIVDQGMHSTKSDFVRECVRRKLEELGLELCHFEEVKC